MSSFECFRNAVGDLIDQLTVAELLCDEQAERIAALEAEQRALGLGPVHAANGGRVSQQRIARLESENRYLREALVLARRFIDPEQHDVIEEIDMTLHGDLDDTPHPAAPAG